MIYVFDNNNCNFVFDIVIMLLLRVVLMCYIVFILIIGFMFL